jgi:DnaJ-class molecular chaperone
MFWRWTKIYEIVKCAACQGTGRMKEVRVKASTMEMPVSAHDTMMRAVQGICLGCNGAGVHSVLREER